MATVFPDWAVSSAHLQRSISFFIGVVNVSFSGNIEVIRSTYTVYPQMTSDFSIAEIASSVIISFPPGPNPTA